MVSISTTADWTSVEFNRMTLHEEFCFGVRSETENASALVERIQYVSR